MTKKDVMRSLASMWIHLGSSQDNDEPVDCDGLQAQISEIGDFLCELWEVNRDGDSVKYGAAVGEPGLPKPDLFELFVMDENGETEYQRLEKVKADKQKPS